MSDGVTGLRRRLRIDAQGWFRGVARTPSPNHDARPAGTPIDLIVVHSISLPPGVFDGDAIERLFTNRLDPSAHPAFASLRDLKVSAHLLVRRGGEIVQFVGLGERAWHAGVSGWRGRERCNDRAIGIELEGTDRSPFTHAQYLALAALARAIRAGYPISAIVGHSDIAPGRKTDPGGGFDWSRFAADLA